MKLLILNGPNLNLLGTRESDIYGSQKFEDYLHTLQAKYSSIEIEYKQSNSEGTIIDILQESENNFDGVILNAAAYTHTSIAIRDAIAAISTPVVEVHISNIHAREDFRKKSIITEKCVGIVSGLGLSGYEAGVIYFVS